MKVKNYIYATLSILCLMFGMVACTPTEYELGGATLTADDLAEGIAYTVTHDTENPNIVYLESKMGSEYTSLWETPQGRYEAQKVTLKMPFAGEYEVTFGVIARQGVVYGNPTHFTIDNICTDFVTSEVWTLLAGGVNGEKTWIYDNGSYGYCQGELSYGDPSANTELGFGNFTANWDPEKGHCGDDAMWDSYMTFDLKSRAGYTFYNSSTGTTQEGVFGLNESTYVLSISDADLMHPDTWTARLSNWRQNLQIIELDENHLRVAYTRIPGDWGGEWIEVFNYVSKEYADNYVPPVDGDAKPELADTWKTDISVLNKDYNSYREIKWVLTDGGDAAAYCDLYGKLESGKQSASDAGSEMSLILNSGSKAYTMTDADGNTKTGTYSINDNGTLSFSNGLLSTVVGKDGAVFKANDDNTLSVLSYTMDNDEITDLWLGYDIKDAHGARYKYQGFHFVPTIVGGATVESFKAGLHFFNTGWGFTESETVKVTGPGTYTFKLSGTDTDPYGMYLDVVKILEKYPNFDMTITDIRVDGNSIAFDDTQIERCTGDETDASGNGITARRYILNPWNSENYFMANGYSVLGFNSSLEVDVNIVYDNGTPYISASEAKGHKQAHKRAATAKRKTFKR